MLLLTDDHSFRLEASFAWSMYRRCRLASVGLWIRHTNWDVSCT